MHCPCLSAPRRLPRLCGLLAVALWPAVSRASLLPPELEEKMADFLGVAVLVIVPVIFIALFWIVHVMPEKIAAKRHHPQKDAIHTLCLLSLFFGGLLWPIAWLWAYTKPVGYKAAYGTDRHEDYYRQAGAALGPDAIVDEHVAQLGAELDMMAAKGALPTDLESLRSQIAQMSARHADAATGA
ncbi:uncharacterized protein DUF3302 [Rivibacter subsaxonicus]|uniref:Uncharacterized protein DUF3302 n=2 Tax=Rivibacter subsaxonicus TaxID=457575 RepID=A0A4Q7W1I5_9BURK|nr:uncharacterized protein DUF3302 [Rivibacter subsaxonicus]